MSHLLSWLVMTDESVAVFGAGSNDSHVAAALSDVSCEILDSECLFDLVLRPLLVSCSQTAKISSNSPLEGDADVLSSGCSTFLPGVSSIDIVLDPVGQHQGSHETLAAAGFLLPNQRESSV